MADSFILYLFTSRHSFYTRLIWGCLQIQLGLIWSVGIWTSSEAKLQAAQAHQTWQSPSELTEGIPKVNPKPTPIYGGT